MVNKQRKPPLEIHTILKLVLNKQNTENIFIYGKKVIANYKDAHREQNNDFFFCTRNISLRQQLDSTACCHGEIVPVF